MASLADRLQSQHLDEIDGTNGDAKADGSALGSEHTPEAEAAQETAPPSADATPLKAANGVSEPTNGAAVSAKKNAVNLADLPQLKGSRSRGSPSVRKWGAATLDSDGGNHTTNGDAVANGSPAISRGASSSPGDSPAISRMSPTRGAGSRPHSSPAVITVSLDIPSEASAVSEAVKHVSKAKNVVIEASKAPVPNKATFLIKGASPEILDSARKLLEVSLSPKVSVEVFIPSHARSALIGTRGANLRALERKYAVKIELKPVETKSVWTLERTKVIIEGNSISVDEAAQAVLDVVDESRLVSSAREFASNLHRFLLASEDWGSMVNQKAPKITIRGQLNTVLDEMKQVDALIAKLESTYETLPFDDETKKANVSGLSIPTDLIFSEYGVVVLPEQNALFGPREALPKALKHVKKFLASQKSSTLDISQAHERNIAHARLLSRYFTATKTLERIAAEHNVSVAGPDLESGGVSYTFSGEDRSTVLARKALVQEVNTLSPTSLAVVRGMRYRLARAHAEKILKDLNGPVAGLIGPSDELFLLFREPEDDFTPNVTDVQRHMDEALAKLEPIVELTKNITKKTVKVGENNVTLALNPLGPEAKELFNKEIGSRDDVDIEEEDSTSVVLSGTKNAVKEAAAVIPKIVQLSRNHALRASHVEEFAIDPAIIGNLIGRQGSQIQSLRSKYDVKLDIDENNHVRIQGVEEQTKACAKEILDIQRRWRDEATENLAIPSVYHSKLIGAKGKHVKRLREQHQCIIRFPKTRQSSVDSYSDDDQASSNGDASITTDEDLILIKGPSRGVAAIKKEFLDLVAFERSQSHSEAIKVPASVVPRVVGRGGMAINSIRNSTGTNINVGTSSEGSGESSTGEEDVEITVVGEKKAVESAISQIRKAADTALDTVEVTLEVEPEMHRLLIGAQNSIRRKLVAEAGGDPELAGRILVVGVNGQDSPLVKIVGPSAVVAKLKSKVSSIVDDAKQRSQASSALTLPRDRLRFILGSGGAKRREIEEENEVYIHIPKDSTATNSKPRSGETVTITVQGASNEVVDKALAVLRKLALPSELTVQIAAPSWTPKLRNNAQSQFAVRVDAISNTHANPTPEIPAEPADGSDWIVKTTSTKMTIQIMGENKEDCDKAAEYLQAHGNANTYGYLWIPQSKHRTIIGSGGKTINKLRQTSKAAIDVPSAYSKSNNKPIVIVGNVEQVEHAKKLLLETAQTASKN